MSDFDKENKALSIIGFVAALLAIVLDVISCFTSGTLLVSLGIASIVLAAAAIVISALALKKKQGIKALAIIGLILGIVFLALTLIILIAIICFVGGAISGAALTTMLGA